MDCAWDIFAVTASGRGKGAGRLNNYLNKVPYRPAGRSLYARPTEARLLGSRFGRGHTAATRARNPRPSDRRYSLYFVFKECARNNLRAKCCGQHLASAHGLAFDGRASTSVSVCKLQKRVDVFVSNSCLNLIVVGQSVAPFCIIVLIRRGTDKVSIFRMEGRPLNPYGGAKIRLCVR
jgi:hypothetical protein